jgi:hypothetical protein
VTGAVAAGAGLGGLAGAVIVAGSGACWVDVGVG